MESTTSYTFPVQTGGILYFPWHRHQIEGTDNFYCLLRKTLAKWGKRNLQSSEAKFSQWYSNPGPVRHSNPLGHRAPRDSNRYFYTRRIYQMNKIITLHHEWWFYCTLFITDISPYKSHQLVGNVKEWRRATIPVFSSTVQYLFIH